jgi:exodeoxyribonuclease-5
MGSATEGPQLTDEQAEAVDQLLPALKSRLICSLIGPAGSGKSFTLGHLLKLLEADGQVVTVACPTHKASKVARSFLAQAGAAADVRTVASLLKIRPRLDADGHKVFAGRGASHAAKGMGKVDLIVVDEASMVGASTGQELADLAKEIGSSLLLVGDRFQLPPVSDGEMSALFLDPPGGAAQLETVQRSSGAVLALATAIREADHPRQAWPRQSTGSATGSRVVVHPHQGSWKAAAARAICSPDWDADPDSARIVGWANRTVATLGQGLRIHRYGQAAARQWQIGELLIAPSGLPCEGQALGQPLAPACSEFRVVELGPVQPLEMLLNTYDWHTEVRRFERQLEVTAATTAQRAVLEMLGADEQVTVWLEPPAGLANPWASQCRELRNSIRMHLSGGDRKQALAELADLVTQVPTIRQGAVLTCHSSQGSTFGSVFVAGDLARCEGPEASALAYVAVSRASEAVHLLPWPGAAAPQQEVA